MGCPDGPCEHLTLHDSFFLFLFFELLASLCAVFTHFVCFRLLFFPGGVSALPSWLRNHHSSFANLLFPFRLCPKCAVSSAVL